MKYYNLSVNIRQRFCVVIGGGNVAYRKAQKLCLSGANVTVVSLDFIPEFKDLKSSSTIELVQSDYSKDKIKNAILVFAATSDFEVNNQICKDAKSMDIWVNSVNGEDYGNFIIPATCKKDILTISLTTEGKAPILSKELRKYFQEKIQNISTDLLQEVVNLRKEMVEENDNSRKKEIERELKMKTKQIINQIDQGTWTIE